MKMEIRNINYQSIVFQSGALLRMHQRKEIEMLKVYKYLVVIGDYFSLGLPQDAQVLKVEAQRGRIWLWALVDETKPIETRKFGFAGTGHEIDGSEILSHIGTFQTDDGQLVWHIFEVKGD